MLSRAILGLRELNDIVQFAASAWFRW